MWNAETGDKIGGPLQHPGPVVDGGFAVNGTRVVTVSLKNVHVWDSESGTEALAPLRHGDIVNGVALHPTAKLVATACKDRIARVWNFQTGNLVTSAAHGGEVWSVIFSPDGERFATLSNDKMARVWRTDNGQAITPPLAHSGEVFRAAFSADGRYLATASWNDTATVWDTTTGQIVGPKRTHRGDVWAVAFSPDGRQLASASHDGSAALWNWDDGLIVSMDHLDARVNFVDFRPDGKLLATASGRAQRGIGLGREARGESRVWDVATGDAVTPSLIHRNAAKRVQFSPDGRWVVSASADGTARLTKLDVERRPVGELQQLAELLGGRRIGDRVSLDPVPSDESVALFESLQKNYPASFAASPGAIAAWDKESATESQAAPPEANKPAESPPAKEAAEAQK